MEARCNPVSDGKVGAGKEVAWETQKRIWRPSEDDQASRQARRENCPEALRETENECENDQENGYENSLVKLTERQLWLKDFPGYEQNVKI